MDEFGHTMGEMSNSEPQRPVEQPVSTPNPIPQQPQQQQPSLNQNQRPGNDNTVFIGSKPVMNYVTSILMQFTNQNSPEVVVKARGKFISKAVDVVEVARKRFMEKQNISIKDIKIDTEGYEKEGKKINVSTIDIALTR